MKRLCQFLALCLLATLAVGCGDDKKNNTGPNDPGKVNKDGNPTPPALPPPPPLPGKG